MIKYIQTSLSPGNCVQTSIACILNVNPETLPSQVYWEERWRNADEGLTFDGWGSYQNILDGYLATHHGLIYTMISDQVFPSLRVKSPGYHTVIGPTIRTQAQIKDKSPHTIHCAVGRYGQLIWDPHPTHQGLLEIERWGVLAPVPQRLIDYRIEKARTDKNYKRVFIDCCCPACYTIPLTSE